jgi:hypothetical protein
MLDSIQMCGVISTPWSPGTSLIRDWFPELVWTWWDETSLGLPRIKPRSSDPQSVTLLTQLSMPLCSGPIGTAVMRYENSKSVGVETVVL